MILYNALFVPLLFVFSTVLIQLLIDHDSFIDLYATFGIGILGGIVYIIIASVLDRITGSDYNKTSIILKAFLTDGLLITVVICGIFGLISYKVIDGVENNSLPVISTICFSLISGILTTQRIWLSVNTIFFDSILQYISYGSLILLISVIMGFGFKLFSDGYSIVIKIIFATLTILLVTAVYSFYNLTFIYNSYLHMIYIIPGLGLVTLAIVFRESF